MSVELYFVKPDPGTGRVIFPFWDEQGEPLYPVEHRVITSLKWTAGKGCLIDAGVGMSETPIPPEELVAGGRRGLLSLLGEVAAMHPDFQALAELAEGVGDDVNAIDGLLYAFEVGDDWVGGDAAARDRAREHTRNEFSSLHWLMLEMVRAGEKGFYSCWSY